MDAGIDWVGVLAVFFRLGRAHPGEQALGADVGCGTRLWIYIRD